MDQLFSRHLHQIPMWIRANIGLKALARKCAEEAKQLTTSDAKKGFNETASSETEWHVLLVASEAISEIREISSIDLWISNFIVPLQVIAFISRLRIYLGILVVFGGDYSDEAQNLLDQINSYRSSLNLTALKPNDNAKCLASGLADQFKGQPCTNTTGSDTVPGTEPQFSDYPAVLSKCHLNVTVTRDGAVLPACIPNLSPPDVVLSNYTQSQYSSSLNDTKFTGIGIGSENDWIVVVLTTDTPEGGFTPDPNAGSDSANSSSKLHHIQYYTFFMTLMYIILCRAN